VYKPKLVNNTIRQNKNKQILGNDTKNLFTLWQVYQFVKSSKMEVQVLFSQGICVCLSNYNYLLILVTVIDING